MLVQGEVNAPLIAVDKYGCVEEPAQEVPATMMC